MRRSSFFMDNGYMGIHSDVIPAEKRIPLFPKSALRRCRVHEGEILEPIEFINSFDRYALAQHTIRDMHKRLG